MIYNILAYASLAVYILIMGMKRFKTNKVATILTCIIATTVCLTIGARIVWFIEDGAKDVQALFSLKFGNLKILGAFLGAILGMGITMLIFKKERTNIFNTCLEGIFLCGGVGKIGCFMKGCCLGKATTLPWGISYPEHGFYNLHPVQLYEAIVWWIGFILLLELNGKVTNPKKVSIAILWYVLIRMFVLEGIYAGGQFLGNSSMRLLYAAVIFVCCIVFMIEEWKGDRKDEKSSES